MHHRTLCSVLTALVVLALAPAAHAQYTAPPPERGFEYIFDGTASGSDASFDKWLSANGATAVTLDPELGAMNPNTSGFGMKWYPVRALGDVVVRLEYMWPDTPTATPNGGVMVRFPDPRYVGTTAEVLAQKPTGYNYDLCPSAAPAFCGLPAPAPSTTYDWRRRRPAVPAAVPLRGRLLRPQRREQRHQPGGHRASRQRRERQQPPALAVGLLRTRDPGQRDAPDPGQRRDQDRLDVRLRQPQRQAVADQRAPDARRLAHHGDPDGRPAVHRPGRRQRHQPVRQRRAAARVAQRRPADPGAPVPGGVLRAPDPRRYRPDLLPRDPGQGARRAEDVPRNVERARGRRLRPRGQAPDVRPRRVGEHARRPTTTLPGTAATRSGPTTCTTTRPRRRTSGASTLRPTRSTARCRCRSAAR